MACGCVPIASDGGGLPDAVGKAGLLFERNNPASLLHRSQELLASVSLEQELRVSGVEHLTAHRPEIVARKYLDVIETALTR
jgi:glycosyltransferase involved in cell wall biosynthesis